MGWWFGLMGWVWGGAVVAPRCFVAITTFCGHYHFAWQDITISLVLQLP
jgi:hypothetical protein